MLKDNWLERQLATVKELLEDGQRLTRENKLVNADAKLKEAGIILDSAETITDKVLQMRYVVYSELATIAGRTGDGGAAMVNYTRALKACEALAEHHGNPMALEMLTTCVNLGGVYAGVGRLKEAEDVSRRALDLIKSLPEGTAGEHAKLMTVFANYHLGAVLHAGPDRDMAYGPLREAIEASDALPEQSLQTARPLLAECLTRLADIDARNERLEKAIEQEDRAATMSLELYEGSNQRTFLQGYINSLTRLIDYAERAHKFDTAEDTLFKIIDMLPDNEDVVARGKKFYETILALSDEELEAGGLPREEALESLQEIVG